MKKLNRIAALVGSAVLVTGCGFEQTINTLFNVSFTLSNSSDWPNWYEGNEFKAIRDAQISSKDSS